MENFEEIEQTNRVINIPFGNDEILVVNRCTLLMKLISFSFNVVASILAFLAIAVFILAFSSMGNQGMLWMGTLCFILSVISFFLSRALFKSSRAFQDVVNTAIDDQGFLIEGFLQLRKFFLSLGILIAIIIVVLIVTAIIWSYSSFNHGIV